MVFDITIVVILLILFILAVVYMAGRDHPHPIDQHRAPDSARQHVWVITHKRGIWIMEPDTGHQLLLDVEQEYWAGIGEGWSGSSVQAFAFTTEQEAYAYGERYIPYDPEHPWRVIAMEIITLPEDY